MTPTNHPSSSFARISRWASVVACLGWVGAIAACSGAAPRDARASSTARPSASAYPSAAASQPASAPTGSSPPPVAAHQPSGTASCAGPADPAWPPERVRLFLQGDDTYPRAEIRALGPGVVPALITLATSSQDDYARYRAITLIGDVGCRETAPTIEALLGDVDPLARMYATTSIKTLLGRDATPQLVRMLKDSDRGVLKLAIKGLGEVGDDRALPELERFSRTTKEAWLREHALRAAKSIRERKP